MPDSKELPSTIFMYPFEKIIKAFSNLANGRKIAPSIARIITVIACIAISCYLPQIPAISVYLIGFISAGIGISGAGALAIGTMGLSIVLMAVSLAIVKKAFQLYYSHKYEVTNSEHRLTARDIKRYKELYPEMSEEQMNKFINDVQEKIQYVLQQLKKYKKQERYDMAKSMKYILNRLKYGDIESFDNYYQVEVYKRTRHIEKLQKALDSLNAKHPELRENEQEQSIESIASPLQDNSCEEDAAKRSIAAPPPVVSSSSSSAKGYHLETLPNGHLRVVWDELPQNRPALAERTTQELCLARKSGWQTGNTSNITRSSFTGLAVDDYMEQRSPTELARSTLRVWDRHVGVSDSRDKDLLANRIKEEMRHQDAHIKQLEAIKK
jgi:prepilin signal peptidase PulO-like enzyme (type II secretory pathway)